MNFTFTPEQEAFRRELCLFLGRAQAGAVALGGVGEHRERLAGWLRERGEEH